MLIVFISKKIMKAIKVIEDNLVISETPVPLPRDDEVLIKVKAAGINRADIAQRKGLYPPPAGASEILGLECSGIIESVGKNVSARQPGDEVIALPVSYTHLTLPTTPYV